jgi:phosphohistidine phosphatase
MGKHLRRRAVKPDLIISSPAVRAYSTACLLAAEIDYPQSNIEKNDLLYFDGAAAMLEIMQLCSPQNSSLMLVSHNPDITSFLNKLCGYQVDSMPTCAVATIAFESEWSDIKFKMGQLIDFDYPKKTMSNYIS